MKNSMRQTISPERENRSKFPCILPNGNRETVGILYMYEGQDTYKCFCSPRTYKTSCILVTESLQCLLPNSERIGLGRHEIKYEKYTLTCICEAKHTYANCSRIDTADPINGSIVVQSQQRYCRMTDQDGMDHAFPIGDWVFGLVNGGQAYDCVCIFHASSSTPIGSCHIMGCLLDDGQTLLAGSARTFDQFDVWKPPYGTICECSKAILPILTCRLLNST
ncbi:hypothetical protein CAPTEDRAFT_218458 [Capitella teleta]|uniref:Uncharacterized protein n=1 Tax=Capitella teleta TaxID=283909 RepID=R7VJI0_CAPTE|nr:hypothetical protein CAPTEDRAFT_218458 [Capitella teleta]|eukprot:ELU18732.1 hypothetical protein CAPTEDRAFT_218458 [Capitella teleta]